MTLLRLAGRQFTAEADTSRPRALSRRLIRVLIGVAALSLAAGALAIVLERAGQPARVGDVATTARGWASLPAALQPLASANAGAADRAYAIHAGTAALSASNPAQGLKESFSSSGRPGVRRGVARRPASWVRSGSAPR